MHYFLLTLAAVLCHKRYYVSPSNKRLRSMVELSRFVLFSLIIIVGINLFIMFLCSISGTSMTIRGI